MGADPVKNIKIDPRVDSYKTFFDHAWANACASTSTGEVGDAMGDGMVEAPGDADAPGACAFGCAFE